MQHTTRYEIAVRDTSGKRWLVAYTERHTQRNICENFAKVHPLVERLIAPTDAAWDRARKRYIAAEWEFGFTGRTQLQARQDGELPHISSAA
jgi:hypothetical protein